jgi:hypothetical protein
MVKKINRWVFYRITRLSIRAKWLKTNLSDLSNIQSRVMGITLASIVDPDSEMMINPTIDYKVGEKYYIKKYDSKGDVEKFITISKTSNGYSISLVGHELINGTTHKYHFDIWFNDSYGQLIIERFRKNLKRRRDKMEIEIRKDDEKTLDLILNKTKKSY